MALPIEDYAAARGHRHLRPGRPGRLGRLAVPAAVRLAGLLRRAAGRARARPVAARPGRGAGAVTHPVVRREHVRPRDDPRDQDGRRCKVTDLMPIGDGRADVVRRSKALEGTVEMRHEWIVRFSYGKVRPWVTRRKDEEGQRGHLGDRRARTCSCSAATGSRRPRDGVHVDDFDVSEGEALTFSTTWFKSHRPIPPMLDVPSGRIETHRARREKWADQCTLRRPVRRCGRAIPARAAAADPRRHRRHRRGRRRPRCPRTSAASATGTTDTAGCATPRSPSRP